MKIEQIYTGCLARVGNDKTIHVIGFAFWGSTFEWRAGQIIMSILRWRGKGVDSQKKSGRIGNRQNFFWAPARMGLAIVPQ